MFYENNTGAISLALNPVQYFKTKHIDIHYHFIRKKIISGEIHVEHVSTHDQLADILTKPLNRKKWSQLIPKLGLTFDFSFSGREGQGESHT
jgi:hypothetical protein